MRKMTLETSLPVAILKEKKRYVAYTPALDLSTSGKSYKEVQKRFEEAVQLFIEEIIRRGTFEEVLEELGWQRVNKEWRPPMVVSQQSETVRIPLPA